MDKHSVWKLIRWNQSAWNPMLSRPLAPCANDLAQCWDQLQHCVCMLQGTHLVTGYFVPFPCRGFTMKALAAAALGLHWSDIMVMLSEVMLWLHYGYVMVMLWLLLWLLCQPGERLLWLPCQLGENKWVCSSYSSLSLLASQIAPCLPWVQQTMQILWTGSVRQLS